MTFFLPHFLKFYCYYLSCLVHKTWLMGQQEVPSSLWQSARKPNPLFPFPSLLRNTFHKKQKCRKNSGKEYFSINVFSLSLLLSLSHFPVAHKTHNHHTNWFPKSFSLSLYLSLCLSLSLLLVKMFPWTSLYLLFPSSAYSHFLWNTLCS